MPTFPTGFAYYPKQLLRFGIDDSDPDAVAAEIARLEALQRDHHAKKANNLRIRNAADLTRLIGSPDRLWLVKDFSDTWGGPGPGTVYQGHLAALMATLRDKIKGGRSLHVEPYNVKPELIEPVAATVGETPLSFSPEPGRWANDDDAKQADILTEWLKTAPLPDGKQAVVVKSNAHPPLQLNITA